MKIGDVVIPNNQNLLNKILHCGSGRYTHAIVGSLDPFIIVSDSGDMVWSCTWEPHELTALCQASETIVNRVINRLKNDRLIK